MLLELGPHRFDVTHRAVVVGLVDGGAALDPEAVLASAEGLRRAGADALEVHAVAAGPGPDVSEAEEQERVAGAVEALVARFAEPVVCATWRGAVAREAYRQGAVAGADASGFADPAYLPAAAQAGATVIAIHTGLGPTADHGTDDELAREVGAFLATRVAWAEEAGLPRERIVIDAGLGLGKSGPQSAALLRRSGSLVALPVVVSATNGGRAPVAADALAIGLGCRMVRTRDARAARRVRDVMAEVLAARQPAEVRS